MTAPSGQFDPAGLLALHALLEERHVTRAARRLGLTQSSMSHRLALLRRELGDPLLVRVKGALVPTQRAQAMARPLAEALEALRRAVRPPEIFDPTTSHLTVSLGMPDLLAPLLPGLLEELTAGAPNVQLQVLAPPPSLGDALAAGVPSMALAPVRDVPQNIVCRPLGDVQFGVALRRGHPLLKGKLTLERWLSVGHVVVRQGTQSPNLVSQALAKQKVQRRVGVEVPTFLAGLFVVAGSDLVMNAPLPLVKELAAPLGLVLREAPVPLPRQPSALLWHERFQHDPAHQWARERVIAAVQRRLISPSP
jgi:DNA-binding transcriptional LysR family regulator